MSEDDVERTLRNAFDAQARGAVGDQATPPPPRFATAPPAPRRHRRTRLLAPLAAAAAVVAVVASVAALQDSPHTTGVHSASPLATQSPVRAVHIKLFGTDGSTYGVGMPVIAFFSKKITSGKALQDTTTATVNGKPLRGAWYFEPSNHYRGYPIEAHWRPEAYWPAHAKIHVDIPAKGLSAGNGLSFDDSLTIDFSTGARNVSVVNDRTNKMTVTSDGKQVGSYPVSLGMKATPTTRGVKVIMDKGERVCMSGPGYRECNIKYAERLTYDGEYLLAAPWNIKNIELGVDSSNGCTNLLPADAARLYKTLEIGDVVEYPNASGPPMPVGAGFGDWNVPWSTWQAGGLVPTR